MNSDRILTDDQAREQATIAATWDSGSARRDAATVLLASHEEQARRIEELEDGYRRIQISCSSYDLATNAHAKAAYTIATQALAATRSTLDK